jgi:hypothetical protein
MMMGFTCTIGTEPSLMMLHTSDSGRWPPCCRRFFAAGSSPSSRGRTLPLALALELALAVPEPELEEPASVLASVLVSVLLVLVWGWGSSSVCVLRTSSTMLTSLEFTAAKQSVEWVSDEVMSDDEVMMSE